MTLQLLFATLSMREFSTVSLVPAMNVTEQEHLIQELRRREAYLAEAQRLSHTGSFGWRTSTGEIVWSEETFRIFQYEQSTPLRNDLIVERIHPEDRALVKQTFEGASSKGIDIDFEHRLLMPDGSVKYVHVFAHAMRDHSGDTEYVGAVMDVTASRRADDELKKSEQKYRDVLDLSPDAIYLSDKNGNLLLANPEGLELLGLTAQEAVGLPMIETYLPEDRQIFWERVEKARTGTRMRFERTFVRKDGTQIPVEVSAAYLHQGYLTVMRDISERKRAETKLRRNEAYLAEAQKLSRTGSWAGSAGPTRSTDWWSAEMFRIMGFPVSDNPPPVEELSKNFSPETWDSILEMFETIRRMRTTCDGEFPMVLGNGSQRMIRIVGHPVIDAAGNIVEFVGTTIDITEQRQARAELEKALAKIKQSEDRLRVIVDTIPTPSWSTRPDGSAEFLSHGWLEYTGLSAEEARNWGWTVVLHDEDSTALVDKWRWAVATGEPFEAEARFRRADGKYRWCLCRGVPLRDESGNIVQWYGTTTDIEDRKRAEEELRASESNLRLLIDAIPGMVIVSSNEGKLEYVNVRILDYTGKSLDELADVRWTSVLHPDDVEAALGAWLKSVETGLPYDAEWRMLCRDGAYRWFHSRAESLRDDEGHIIRWYGLLHDIDDRKNAEEVARMAQVELAHVTRVMTVGELVASIAHEVNQPLGAIVTNGQACVRLLSREVPDLDKSREVVGRIIKDGMRASEVIKRIRDLLHKTPSEKAPVNINETIQEVIALVSSDLLRSKVELKAELAADLPPVIGDRIQLQQVILNLILNARDAMSGAQIRKLQITSRSNNSGAIVVAVCDTGHGLETKDVDRIFDPFFTTKSQGMGLGLSISRTIIEAHGGTLWATQNEEKGATIQFTLPGA